MTFSWLDSQYLGGPVYTSYRYFWMYLTKVYQEPFHYLDFVFKTVRFVTTVFALTVIRWLRLALSERVGGWGSSCLEAETKPFSKPTF